MRQIFLTLLVLMTSTILTKAQDSTAFADYYGKYKFEPGSPVAEVNIVWQDSSLDITSDMGSAAMQKLGVDSFKMDYMDGTVIFTRDSATQKVKGIKIDVQGTTLDGTKEDETANGTSLISRPIKKEEAITSR